VRRFAEGPLRRRLGWGEGPIEVSVPGEGKRSLLFSLDPPGGRASILRLFEAAEPYRRYWRTLALAKAEGAPTPRLIDHGGGLWARWRLGGRYVLESRLPGRRPDAVGPTPELRAAVGRALARLHAIERDHWGPVDRPAGPGFAETLQRQLDRRMRDLRTFPEAVEPAAVDRMESWFRKELGALAPIRRFQLCHLHLGKDDILYDSRADAAAFIDCGGAAFHRAARDLAHFQPYEKGWIGDGTGLREFLSAYVAESPPERAQELQREGPLFEAWLLLNRLRADLRAAARGKPLTWTGKKLLMRDRLLGLTGGLKPKG